MKHKQDRRKYSRDRQRSLLRTGKCVNNASHGKATHGERCAWCNCVNNRGLATTLRLEEQGLAPARPPGYKPRPHRPVEQREYEIQLQRERAEEREDAHGW